jgi:hypothetical protein
MNLTPKPKLTNSKPVIATYDGKELQFDSLKAALKNYGLEHKYSQYASVMNRKHEVLIEFTNGLDLLIERVKK